MDCLSRAVVAILDELVSSISQVVNLFLDGKCPMMIGEYIDSASLTLLVKLGGGIRTIVVVTVWRHLVSKVSAVMIGDSLDGYLDKLQFGVGMSGGGKAILHAVNAFNLVDQNVMLEEVRLCCLAISRWVEFYYSSPTRLYYREHTLWSCQGAWYLDDGTIVGDTLVVEKVLELIMKDGSRCGLHLKVDKTEIFWPKEDYRSRLEGVFPSNISRPLHGVKFLGGLVSVDFDFSSELVMKRVYKTVGLMDVVAKINDPYSRRSFDLVFRSALERIVTASGPGFDERQRRLATLPHTFGRLGVYSATSSSTFDDALCVFNTSIEINLLSNPCEIAAPKLMKKITDTVREMEDSNTGASMLRSYLKVTKIWNINGKILGKDGKPMKAYRQVKFGTKADLTVVQGTKETNDLPNGGWEDDENAMQNENGDSNAQFSKIQSLSFDTMVQDQPVKKMVKIKELCNDEKVEGAAVDSFINCSKSKNECARALVEISLDVDLIESIVIAIPYGDGKGHTLATIDMEYEWRPPHCTTCKIFDQTNESCPNLPKMESKVRDTQTSDDNDGFVEVKKKKSKRKQPRQVDKIRINKPKPNFYYRRVDKGVTSKSQQSNEGNGIKTSMSTSNKGSGSKINNTSTLVTLANSFSALHGEENDTDKEMNTHQWEDICLYVNESDSEEIEELVMETDPNGTKAKIISTEGASTPIGSRIIMSWNQDEADLTIIAQDDQVIHTRIWMKIEKKELFCSFIYAHNHYHHRRVLWKNLGMHKLYVRQRPWCMLGDFNAAFFLDDMVASLASLDISMQEFNDCVEDVEGAHAIFQPYRIFDHATVVLSIHMAIKVKPRPFKFVNILVHNVRFKEVVSDGWNVNVSGFHMFKVVQRLKNLKKPLRKMLYDHGNIHENVDRLRVELDKVQRDLDLEPFNNDLRDKEAGYVQEFNEALLMEERFLKQKAKIEWLRVGDTNSVYFHKSVKSRASRNRIDVITNSEGVLFKNDKVADVFLAHYEVFLGQAGNYSVFNTSNLFEHTLNEVAAHDMVRTINIKEVKDAIFSMGNDKSPWPDGFTATRRVRDSGSFTYHRHCSKLDLVNLCFADDLFLFSYGDVESAKVIMEALDEFKCASGLTPSLPKSTAYFCNVLNHVKLSILQVLPFNEGRIPVRYLGVPLVSSRLIYTDSNKLVEKVQRRVNDWKDKSLSTAGRLQLIQLVVGSLHVYWASMFILPTRILLDIEQMMRDEGGLGIRRLGSFNQALMVSHLWKILTLKDSLWVKWIYVYKLKDRNFWDVPLRGNIKWEWRNILHLRPLICEFFWYNIGDGSHVSAWFDNWCALSPLANVISSRDIFRVGFDKHSKVCDLIIDDQFNRFGAIKHFSIQTIWNDIRPRGAKVDWRRLKTQDKLRAWDYVDWSNLTCALCELQPDSHEHLFFDSVFSQQVWSRVQHLAGLPNSAPSIDAILLDIAPFSKTRTCKSIVTKLVVAVAAYFIWQERNVCIVIIQYNMSASNQQTLADSRANEIPQMLEKGNYIPWESRFRRFLDNKLKEGEQMWHSIEKGPHVRPMIPDPDCTMKQITEPLSKMIEINKIQYIADVLFIKENEIMDEKAIKRWMKEQQDRAEKMESVMNHFGPSKYEDLQGALPKLLQLGTIEEYQGTVHILINNGSTHDFVRSDVVEKMCLPVDCVVVRL
uniref:Reverse transcriptase domain-containing protein n=1 Tax=Tanacetum cinerariifolium TaxID=118510 RepID=A0A6L2J2V8_TANCI|nr:hypothetical protein [Tanacetum cinerariifolium]